MSVKFLSEEWASTFTSALNNDEAFKKAAGSQSANVQQVVNAPGGEKKFYLKVDGGQAEIGIGETDNPEATIVQDYDTAVALMKGELSATAAFMSGKIKVQGDMMKLMQMQGAQAAGQQVHSTIDVEY